MRNRLSHAAAPLHQCEAHALAAALPTDAPASAVMALTTVANGGLLWLGIAAALATRPGHTRCAARDGAVAIALASASSHLIGRVVPRRRPAADHLPAYQALIPKPTSSSFPSSHTTTAAAFTTATACESPTTGLMVAPLTVTVAYSRLRTRAHWPSDVVAGALWGIAVGLTTRRLLRAPATTNTIQLTRFIARLALHRHRGVTMQY